MVKQNYICEVCNSAFDKKDEAIAHESKPILEDDFNGVVIRDEMNNGYRIFVKKDEVTSDHTRKYNEHVIRINNHKRVENFPDDYSFFLNDEKPCDSIITKYNKHWESVTEKELKLVSVLLKSEAFSDFFTVHGVNKFRTRPAYQGCS